MLSRGFCGILGRTLLAVVSMLFIWTGHGSTAVEPGSGNCGRLSTTWFVDAINGDDLNPGTSPQSAFKTLFKALGRNQALANGDVIQVAPGRYDPANGESFPLQTPPAAPRTGIQLIGAGTATTVISATDATGSQQFNTWQYTPSCVKVEDGWFVSGFTIENKFYQKLSGSNNEIRAITANDITNLTIQNCVIDDCFWGIWIEDVSTALSTVGGRTVMIQNCVGRRCGPINGDGLSDKGHAALLIGCYDTMRVTVNSCTFEDNHDGTELGQASTFGGPTPNDAVLFVTNSSYYHNENGIEFGDGSVEVENSTFTLNGAWGLAVGGVDGLTTPRAAIGYRPAPDATGDTGFSLKCRGCTFLNNQVAISFQEQTAQVGLIDVDLGKAPSTGSAGGNSFITATTNPWTDCVTPSYCAIFSELYDVSISAIGNSWTILAGQPANNQVLSGVVSGPVNYTTSANNCTSHSANAPFHRPLPSACSPPSCPSGTSNVPWNYSLGPGIAGHAPPKIRF